MALLQNPIFLVVIIVILAGLFILYRAMRTSKKQSPKPAPLTEGGQNKAEDNLVIKAIPPAAVPDQKETIGAVEPMVIEAIKAMEESSPADDGMDQIINPDINLIPDVLLKPGEETVLLLLPEHVPMEEVKKLEEFLRRVDSLKIVTTGGSSEEGSNIGIRILNPLNLSEVLSKSNMLIIKHVRKKGERVVLSLRNA
jgi:hypothetical protein